MGFLTTRSGPAVDHCALEAALVDLGYREARNLVIERRYAGGDLARLTALVAELVALRGKWPGLRGREHRAKVVGCFEKEFNPCPSRTEITAGPVTLWWISGTFVVALLVTLFIYGVTPPSPATFTLPTIPAPQANTVGQVPKSDDRVKNPVGAPGTNQ